MSILTHSPYILLSTAAEVAAMVRAANQMGIAIHRIYQDANARPGSWYCFGTAVDINVCMYRDSLLSMEDLRADLKAAHRIPVLTNSAAHFIACSKRLIEAHVAAVL